MKPIYLEEHGSFTVLRDDKLLGGTKSRFMVPAIEELYHDKSDFVYASPVYGGFQIALAAAAKQTGKVAHIFCAKRKEMHPNTIAAQELGAMIHEVKPGYLSVTQKRARDFTAKTHGAVQLEFGANYDFAIDAISETMRRITKTLGYEPQEIFCAVGSGVLIQGILKGTDTAQIHGICIGKEWTGAVPERITLHKYPKPFQWCLKTEAPFPSCANYDRKAWNAAQEIAKTKAPFFWNVL